MRRRFERWCGPLLAAGFALGACTVVQDEPVERSGQQHLDDDVDDGDEALTEQEQRGRQIWFENSYGGEKFFTFLASDAAGDDQLEVGFEAVVNTPRSIRHDVWGVINDPDCEANPDGGMDICDDPEATGVIGVRKSTERGFLEFGAACASCHAGFDPKNPPDDPNDPSWGNIHPTIGNQHLQVGKLFAANLDLSDPNDAIRAMVFDTWPDGAVDTTALFSDNINNPGTITAFWEHDNRRKFHVAERDAPQLRNGQGGEDDIGGDIAALRVYTNIGVCFFECVAEPAQLGQPISIDTCRASCPDFPPQQDLDDLSAFLASVERPRYPGGIKDDDKYDRGSVVFDDNCASCHWNDGDDLERVLSNDVVNPLSVLDVHATNACRALSTNWDEGHLWEEFASQAINESQGPDEKGYRTMPLGGIWATAPFMHNQSIGVQPPPNATPEQRRAAFEESMWELLSADRDPLVHTTPQDIQLEDGTIIEAGTPLALVVNRDEEGNLTCGDYVENRGHYFGAGLSDSQKSDLIYFLLFQ